MVTRMLIDGAHPEEPRIVIADDGRLEEFDFESASKKLLKGNIYLAKVTRVEPSLQAAFVEYGGGRQGFLPFAEIHYDYFQIPTADKEKLKVMESQQAAAAEAAEADGRPIPPEMAMEPISQQEGPDQELSSQMEEVQPASPSEERSEVTQAVAIENAYASVAPEEDTSGAASSDGGDAEDELDTIGQDSDAPVVKRSSFYRKYKIQDVIKRNQIVLIQVVKEERGNKGASLTTYVSIAGRYCVFMPNTPSQGGLSRRISSMEDRRRLRDIMQDLELPEGGSAIIRTAGVDRSKPEIKRDFEYLQKLWHSIRELAVSSQAPALVYEEGNLIKRFIRDMYHGGIEEIVVEGEQTFTSTLETMKMFLPSHAGKVKQHAEKMPIFRRFQIEDELLKLYDNRAYLKSGGYIVINPTEALVSIDVNSGRATKERNVEETATKTNLEAAYEIARQLRLRDLAGLVVIDFIDMGEGRNRRAVERALKDALSTDRARIQVGRISPFGLLEMSRQRLRSSFLESNTVVCPHCSGTGLMRSHDSVAVDIIRAIENEAAKGKYEEIHMSCSQEVALFVLNTRRQEIAVIEANYSVRIFIKGDPALIAHNFLVDKTSSVQAKRRRDRQEEQAKENAAASAPIQLDSIQPDELTPLDEVVEAELGGPLRQDVEELGERRFRGERGERGDRGDRGERGGRNRRRRGGRGRDRDRFRDREGRPDRPAQENGNAAASEPANDAGGGQQRFRYRGGNEGQQQPPHGRGGAAVAVAERPATANAPTPALTHQAQDDARHSIIRGLWKKITE